jgi:acyl-CoA reductase-like NAD-dependent aldehyde dehydrogenase
MAFTSIDPTTGAHLASYPAHDREDVGALLDRADAAFRSWREVPVSERAAALGRFAAVFERDVEHLALLLTSEMGKPLAQARGEVMKCADGARYYAANAERLLAPREVELPPTRNYVRHDPIGVVLAIMPWNFPYWQPVRMIAPVIVGGNALLLKAAPNTMGTGEAIAAAMREAGVPDGVVQTLRVEPDVIADVIGDPRVQGVSFTGSTRGGRAVASIAGSYGKRTVLELGGSDPFIVLEDADVEQAAAKAVTARLLNCGQSCIAAKRFVVHRDVVAGFRDALAAGIAAAVLGDPRDPATTVGPMARGDLRDELAGQVERSISAGAEVVVAGGRREGPGFFYAPTLLSGVTRAHAVGGEETFGPAGAILVVDDEDHAIAVANDTEYGLGSSLWSGDVARAERLAARIDAGMVAINDMNVSDVRLPFGGVKASGHGRELAEEGLREFLNTKSIRVAG